VPALPAEPRRPRIALTAGEPAGVGPELVAQVLAEDFRADLVVIASRQLLIERALAAGTLPGSDGNAACGFECVDIALSAPSLAGKLDARNARYVLACLDRAAEGAHSGEFDAIVTAPVHKGIINDAGIPFSGHTEWLAERAGCDVVMLLTSDNLRVALATTHLALSAVPSAITRARLATTMRILDHDLRMRFGLDEPRIAVLGLNPHAGEGGHLGREEIETIIPALEQLRGEGLHLIGPLPADTAFVPRQLETFDAVLAMYHDQGLPVLKHAGFGHAVNVTLGLPYVRTSVDHGTALDIAGRGIADAGSLRSAIRLAVQLARRRNA